MLKSSFVWLALALACSPLAVGCVAGVDEGSRDPGVGESQQAIQTTCGGITGRGCEGTNQCVDDPRDDCDPKRGGTDCGGICVGTSCGGFIGGGCATGYVCVDDPRDSCDPAHGGADCPGTCLYAGEEM